MTDQQLLNVEQIASEFQLSSQTIRNWIKSGALSAVKIGHVYRVRREDVDAMMRRHQGETAPLGTHRNLWAPETLGMPYRRGEDRRRLGPCSAIPPRDAYGHPRSDPSSRRFRCSLSCYDITTMAAPPEPG
jgi:excisionase family DNA binding protein